GPQFDSDGMVPLQPASENAEISTAVERRSMEQAMDTPLRSSSPQTMSRPLGIRSWRKALPGAFGACRSAMRLPVFAENMRQMHLVRGGGKAAPAANVAVCA